MLSQLYTYLQPYPIIGIDCLPPDTTPVIQKIIKMGDAISRKSQEQNIPGPSYQFFWWNMGLTTGVLRCTVNPNQGVDTQIDTQLFPFSGPEKFQPLLGLINILERFIAINESHSDHILILSDCQKYFNSSTDAHPTVVSQLKYLFQLLKLGGNRIILVGNNLKLNSELSQIPVEKIPLPTLEQITVQVKTQLSEYDDLQSIAKDAEKIAFSLKGLCLEQVADFIRLFYVQLSATKSKANLEKIVNEAYNFRSQVLKQQGVDLVDCSNLKSLGGMEYLKQYAENQKALYTLDAQQHHLPYPKGILLVGPMGTGKSCAAKEVASKFKLPLITLDISRCLNSLVGSSENNVAHILDVATAIAPCAMFVDEIDRQTQGQATDSSGVTGRIVGLLLQFMAENKGVFVVFATNHPENLPPELIRAGRLDETFLVDFPTKSARLEILKIHATEQYKCQFKEKDLVQMAADTEGFSGAELERIIAIAALRAYTEKEPQVLNYDRLKTALTQVQPLSKGQYKAQIEEMRKFCAFAKNASFSEAEDVKVVPDSKKRSIRAAEM